jgi:hypothetical protein
MEACNFVAIHRRRRRPTYLLKYVFELSGKSTVILGYNPQSKFAPFVSIITKDETYVELNLKEFRKLCEFLSQLKSENCETSSKLSKWMQTNFHQHLATEFNGKCPGTFLDVIDVQNDVRVSIDKKCISRLIHLTGHLNPVMSEMDLRKNLVSNFVKNYIIKCRELKKKYLDDEKDMNDFARPMLGMSHFRLFFEVPLYCKDLIGEVPSVSVVSCPSKRAKTST